MSNRRNNKNASGISSLHDLDEAEDSLKECYRRLEILEGKLKFKPMTGEEREQAEKDILKLKQILKQQEADIKIIRRKNQSSTFIAVLLIFACFLIYGIFHTLTNEASNPIPNPGPIQLPME